MDGGEQMRLGGLFAPLASSHPDARIHLPLEEGSPRAMLIEER
jgi:hypothetical protein